jgi:hypothetical protein
LIESGDMVGFSGPAFTGSTSTLPQFTAPTN